MEASHLRVLFFKKFKGANFFLILKINRLFTLIIKNSENIENVVVLLACKLLLLNFYLSFLRNKLFQRNEKLLFFILAVRWLERRLRARRLHFIHRFLGLSQVVIIAGVFDILLRDWINGLLQR